MRTPLLLILLAAAGAAPALSAQATDRDLLAARSKGAATAPIRVIELSDFQCPWCRKFTVETAPALDSLYVATGKVRWLFINLPISELHPNAGAAAEMAMCSARQGQFWPMHDIIFRNQSAWAPLREPGPYLLTLADSLRIPRDSILPCLREAQVREIIQRDMNTAGRIGARSTPTFIVEGVLLNGAYPLEVFRHILDSIYVERTRPAPR